VLNSVPSDRVALVTGGSRGIGRAISQLLAADGYKVCVNFRKDAGAAEETVAAIKGAGGTGWAVQADVSDEKQVQALFRNVKAEGGRLDVLINNAGRTHEGLLTLTSADCFLEVLKINLLGAYMCSQAAIRMMLPRRSGCIVNISSAAALRAPLGLGAYAAAKAGLNTMTRSFAREVASRGIRINAVAPAYVVTDMLASAKGGGSGEIEKIPLGRFAQPQEIAAAVASIVRDEFSYLVGQVIVLDGGRGS